MNTIDTELDTIIKKHYLTCNPVSYVIIFENPNYSYEFIKRLYDGVLFKKSTIKIPFLPTTDPCKFYTTKGYDECVVQYVIETIALELKVSYYLSKPLKYVKLTNTNNLPTVPQCDKINVNDVYSIHMSELCMQSLPCQHECIITMNDSTTIKKVYTSKYIYDNFNHLLSEKDKIHCASNMNWNV